MLSVIVLVTYIIASCTQATHVLGYAPGGEASSITLIHWKPLRPLIREWGQIWNEVGDTLRLVLIVGARRVNHSVQTVFGAHDNSVSSVALTRKPSAMSIRWV